MNIFGIILLLAETVFILVFTGFYIYRQVTKIKFIKENRKLAIDQIMESMKEVCIDNDKLYAECCRLQKENSELKEQCKNKK